MDNHSEGNVQLEEHSFEEEFERLDDNNKDLR